jgi:hypothetical protein
MLKSGNSTLIRFIYMSKEDVNMQGGSATVKGCDLWVALTCFRSARRPQIPLGSKDHVNHVPSNFFMWLPFLQDAMHGTLQRA